MNHPDLKLCRLRESGRTFETGKRVCFPYYRYAQETPYMGSRFGQDIEPAGVYLQHKTPEVEISRSQRAAMRRSGMLLESGKVCMTPLVMEFGGYGPDGWKSRLTRLYHNKKHGELSRALCRDGYDGVVTVDGHNTAEIVDLRCSRRGGK